MISCIIPTLNERGAVEALLLELAATFNHEWDIEFIFVDDGSTDGTAEFILDKQKTAPVPLRIIRRQERGLATAVVRGFHEATGDILCVMDADLSHPPEVLKKLIKAVAEDNNDIAVASRRIGGGGVEKWPIHRNLFSQVSALFAWFLAAGVRDPLSGFFCIKKSVIDKIKFNPVGYKILLEVLVKGRYDRIVEVPYMFKNRERGESKLNSTQALLYFKHLWRLYKYKFHNFLGI